MDNTSTIRQNRELLRYTSMSKGFAVTLIIDLLSLLKKIISRHDMNVFLANLEQMIKLLDFFAS